MPKKRFRLTAAQVNAERARILREFIAPITRILERLELTPDAPRLQTCGHCRAPMVRPSAVITHGQPPSVARLCADCTSRRPGYVRRSHVMLTSP